MQLPTPLHRLLSVIFFVHCFLPSPLFVWFWAYWDVQLLRAADSVAIWITYWFIIKTFSFFPLSFSKSCCMRFIPLLSLGMLKMLSPPAISLLGQTRFSLLFHLKSTALHLQQYKRYWYRCERSEKNDSHRVLSCILSPSWGYGLYFRVFLFKDADSALKWGGCNGNCLTHLLKALPL